MRCPYCTSEISNEALVCPQCTRELYLLKPLQEKIEALEQKLKDLPEIEALQARLREIENPPTLPDSEKPGAKALVADLATFWLAPILLLLVAHVLIVIIYDWHTLVLRIASLLIPLPFALFLMQGKRVFWLWAIAAFVMGMLAALGMSAITAQVDHVPVLPQNAREWREFIEYAASIGLSSLSGMIVGDMRRMRREAAENERMRQLASKLGTLITTGQQGAEKLYTTVTKLREVSGSLTAVATTAAATYAGLKAVVGW